MYYLIYSSFASRSFHESDLQALLKQSQINNARCDITGLLYYFRNSFVQLIEGDQEQVTALYQRIRVDERHQFAVILKEGHHEKRFFPDWTMGYKTLDTADLKHMPDSESGYIDSVAVLRLFEISI